MSSSRLVCRSCADASLTTVLSLGQMPLANSLLAAEDLHTPELTYPLELAFCPNCTLLQLTETVPPEDLFSEYLYFSSYSETMLEHARELSERVMADGHLDESSLVVELGSNDGYLLQYFAEHKIPVLGIEPAQNIAAVAEAKGIPTLSEFFGEDIGASLKEDGQMADVILALNVLAHVADLNGVVKGIATLLKEEGVAVFEVPYVKDMVDRCEFDTIYHEHLCYFSVTALSQLFQNHEMIISDVERLSIHGGSLRVTVQHAHRAQPTTAVKALLDEESDWGVAELDYYWQFAKTTERTKERLVDLLHGLKSEGQQVAAYGAAAKGAILLNYCGIGPNIVDFVVDRNPHKQGRYMPGVRIPVHPPERLLDDSPDYTLLLVWNLADEILSQQSAYRRQGGKFVIPIPEPRVA